LVIVMPPVNPPGQLVVTEYATAHPLVAAFAAPAIVAAALTVPPASAAAPRIDSAVCALFHRMPRR
jgi:hypothetical protein